MAYHKIKPLPYIPFLLLLLPALIVGGNIVQTTYTDAFYYGPFVGSLFYVAFDPVSIALYTLAIYVVIKLLHYARTFKKPWKIASYVALAIALPLAALVMFGMMMFLPIRYNMSDAYCQSPLISDLKRCEGFNKSMFQDRSSVVARFGKPIENIEKVIGAYPAYDVHQLPCDELVGNMGEKCFIGQYTRETADTDFFAAYIVRERILILETENIPLLISGQDKNQSFGRVADYLDLGRFGKDMAK